MNLEYIYKFPLTVLNNGDTIIRDLIAGDFYINRNLPEYQQYPYKTKDLCGLHYSREKETRNKKQ